MKYLLIAALFPFAAMATGTTPPTVPPGSEQNQEQQQQQGQQQGQAVDVTTKPTGIGGSVNPIAEAKTGPVSAGAHASGGAGGASNSKSGFSAHESFNTSLTEISNHDRAIQMAEIILNICDGSVSTAADRPTHWFFGIAFTIKNKDCLHIIYANAVINMFDDKDWGREILCLRDVYAISDSMRSAPQCTKNRKKKIAVSSQAKQVTSR